MRTTLSSHSIRLLALCLLLFLTSCGKLELNQMALVMAVGLDKTESGHIRITAQIVRPADARGSTGAPSGGTGKPIWTANAEGASIFEAIRNLGRFSSRRVFWAHNRIIVVGEELAKDDITDLLDFFTRNHELRMNTWIVMTPGKASELVATKTGLEIIPGDSLDRLFRFSQVISEAPRTTIKEVGAAYLSESSNPVMAIVRKKKHVHDTEQPSEFGSKEQIELSGTAVFRKGKMIGTLSPEDSRGLLWFIERVDSGIISLPCPDDPEKPVSLEIKDSQFKIRPYWTGDEAKFDIQLHVGMDLPELGCPTPMKTTEVADILEKEAAKKLKGDMVRMLDKAQGTFKTDFLDLGKVFQNKYPGIWQQMKWNWQQIFTEAQMKVHVQVDIKNPVLLIVPTRPLNRSDGGSED